MLILLIINPSPYIDGINFALNLFVKKVLPTLLPFFIITKILTILGLGYYLSSIFKKPIKFLFNNSPIGGFIFLMSILSGYPIGAKMIAEYVELGCIEKEEAASLVAYTSTSGPLFVIGSVGVGMIGDYKSGLIILISHVAGALLNGLIYRKKSKFTDNSVELVNVPNTFFSDAIKETVLSLLQVGATIVFLNLFIVVLEQSNTFTFLEIFVKIVNVDVGIIRSLIYGCLEMTRGLNEIAGIMVNNKDMIVISATIISLGGFSVYMQSMKFLGRVGISGRYFILTKITHAIFTYAISTILVNVLIR